MRDWLLFATHMLLMISVIWGGKYYIERGLTGWMIIAAFLCLVLSYTHLPPKE